LLLADEHLIPSAQANHSTVSSLTHQITKTDKAAKKKVKLGTAFESLKTVPGIGDLLALTIMLEVGDISRFPKVDDFVSYARCAPTERLSDGKSQGQGNARDGNRHLGRAFIEASYFARRSYAKFSRYYQRKAAKTHQIVAAKAISNKLAQICYYVMRDQVPYREEAIFC
jgi:transposase